MASHEESGERIEISLDKAWGGRWVVPPVSYINPVRRFCAMTGRPIARGYWQVIVGERELAFSDRDHAVRYTTYPLSHAQIPDNPESTASAVMFSPSPCAQGEGVRG